MTEPGPITVVRFAPRADTGLFPESGHPSATGKVSSWSVESGTPLAPVGGEADSPPPMGGAAMNTLEQVSYVSQTVAAIAVLVSLIYAALQVRSYAKAAWDARFIAAQSDL